MANLREYVQQQLTAGYSREQIRQVLLRSGYSEKEISAVLTHQAPVQDSFTVYVQDLLRKGYTPVQLRSWLISQGYTSSQVDTALSPPVQVVHHVSTGTFVKFFFVIFCIGLLFGGGYFAVEYVFTKPALLDYTLHPGQNSVLAGDKVRFSVDLVNLGKGKFDVTLKHKLVDKNGTSIDQLQETIAIDTSVRRSVELNVPKWVSSGQYTVFSEADYSGKKATASFDVTLLGTSPLPKPKQNNTQNNHQTSNQTRDVPIENNQTDQENSPLQPEQPQEQPSVDCSQLQGNRQSTCYLSQARQASNPEFCQVIEDADQRDACYFTFMNQGNYEVCNKFSNQNATQLCSKLFYYKTLSEYVKNNQSQEILRMTNYTANTTNVTNNEYSLDDVLS
jgi:hypothetical protein